MVLIREWKVVWAAPSPHEYQYQSHEMNTKPFARLVLRSLTPEEIKSIPIEAFDCVYSPAKRRGPVPGRSNASKRSSEVGARTSLESETRLGMPSMEELQLRQMMLQNINNPFGMLPEATFFDPQQAALQQQLNLMQQIYKFSHNMCYRM